MDTMGENITARQRGTDTLVSGFSCFDLRDTLDCGQAFRWSEADDGRWSAVVGNRKLTVALRGDEFVLFDTTFAEFEQKWRSYFDFDRDYLRIMKAFGENEILRDAARYASGIRLLKQDTWECLCSFIISQNNNIPRIKGIIERLCENFGERIEGGYTFPSAEVIAGLSLDELAPLRSGFRAKYILDAAQKVASGEIDLENLSKMDSELGASELMKIKGVGPKVADCVLLFGAGKIDRCPKDVWIKRVLTEFFGGALPECALPYAGIAQQYLFHYARTSGVFDR